MRVYKKLRIQRGFPSGSMQKSVKFQGGHDKIDRGVNFEKN